MSLQIDNGKLVQVYKILVDGIKKYTEEHGFKKVVIGLSGGIDSAVVCFLAKEAVGAENVLGVAMPSKYSSRKSEEYAEKLAKNCGIEFKVVPISKMYDSYLEVLEKDLGGNEDKKIEIYHQNLQARIRGMVLMAFSNRFGGLVLATGNRSEAMMGYCTLYGDTVGGLAPISNVFKAGVYALAKYINTGKERIPLEIINRVPSAELKPDQADHHSLPPYEILDEILYLYLNRDKSSKDLINQGFEEAIVKEIISTIDKTEYKRAQCPCGINVSMDMYISGMN